jgi:hypothetical protein
MDDHNKFPIAKVDTCKDLTKREYIASLNLAGYAANPEAFNCMDTQRMIEISILLADELLKKLEVEQ